MTANSEAVGCWKSVVECLQAGNSTQFCLETTDGKISAKLIRESRGKLTLIVEEDENGKPAMRTYTEFKSTPSADEVIQRLFPNHASYLLDRPAVLMLLEALAA